MTRRCSHCGYNGHNSRTCPDRGVRLFGVRLSDSNINSNSPSSSPVAMRKCASMSSLTAAAAASGSLKDNSTTPEQSESGGDGYVSDGLVQASSSSNARERKKGVPWTEEEHRMFLLGLRKLGKGDWRGISRNYVTSRTPTQVASHAQKYFIRQSNLSKRKRRSSLFDISPETQSMEESSAAAETFLNSRPPLPSGDRIWLGISPQPPPPPLPFGLSPFTGAVKTSALWIEEHAELTKLSLGTSSTFVSTSSPPSSTSAFSTSSSLALKLGQPSLRQSAFHANPAAPPTSGALNSAISVV